MQLLPRTHRRRRRTSSASNDTEAEDFTKGLYKFRTTNSGELPTDEDLFRTISRGIPGTTMQTFDSDKIKTG